MKNPLLEFGLHPDLHDFSRGVRRSFPNPYYNVSWTGPNPNSQLPLEHPDFEPEERGVRKLLFGVSRKNGAPKKSGRKSRRVAEGTGRGRQGRREETDMKTMKLKFAA
ncbi:hypothetical protein B0H14DRAFT_2591986 [Mycena olivaceomarginata]|nr:hypothetical protein B0H14DRAFT_2591986 [Mycena olivaceomarginata]